VRLDEARAQAFVPPQDLAQAALETRDVEGALEPEGGEGVVAGAVGLELIQEPETLLGERQRHRRRVGTARDSLTGRRRHAALGQELCEQGLPSGRAAAGRVLAFAHGTTSSGSCWPSRRRSTSSSDSSSTLRASRAISRAWPGRSSFASISRARSET